MKKGRRCEEAMHEAPSSALEQVGTLNVYVRSATNLRAADSNGDEQGQLCPRSGAQFRVGGTQSQAGAY